MMPAIALIALAFAGTAAVVLTRKQPGAPGYGHDSTPRFAGQLRKGQLYRVWLRVEAAYPAWWKANAPQGVTPDRAMLDDLRLRVERCGFKDTLLVTRDPTSPLVFTAITRWGLDAAEAFDAPPIRLYQLQAVEDPPVTSAPSKISGLSTALDAGLTDAEVDAVRIALATNEDPKHLGGFASTLEPDFPVAAALLRAKAMLVEYRGMGRGALAVLFERTGKARRRYPGDLPMTTSFALHMLTSASLGLGEDVLDAWLRYKPVLDATAGWPVRAKCAVFEGRPMNPSDREEARLFRRAVSAIVKNARESETKDFLRLTPEELGRGLGVPPGVAHAAQCVVVEVGPGVRVVVPDAYRAADPLSSLDDLRPSPNALAMVQALARPATAPVSAPALARKRAKAVIAGVRAQNPDAKKAKDALDRATRALARRRWVSWYKKTGGGR